jgi:tRNA pseudouridine32 synthase/23S rRNA pseudouridine746 synthase
MPPGPWATVLDFLRVRFPHIPTAELERRLHCSEIVADDGQPVAATDPYIPVGRLHYYRAPANEVPIPFAERIIYQDDCLVAVDKPHFLPVTPSGQYLAETLLVRLSRSLGLTTLAPMHRLDRETAGIVLFTVQPALRGRYQALFSRRDVDKEYEAIADCREDLVWPLTRRNRLVPGEPFMRMREADPTEDGEPNAETVIDCIERLDDGRARYRLQPKTGKKHQLRVHMAALGLPIHNDVLYPDWRPPALDAPPDYDHPLQLLARRIAFTDPVTGETREFSSARSLGAP